MLAAMPPPTRPSLLPLWFFLGGTALALWLHVFMGDLKRPSSTQERADLLAAQNIASLSLTASTPPSPPHWAQRDVWQDEQTGQRYPLARESAALLIASCLGKPAAAGILAFGLAAASLAWCLALPLKLSGTPGVLVPALALLGVAHGRAWQMIDPFPFLVLAAAALALGGWLRYRTAPSRPNARLLGAGGALLLLCEPALFIPFAATVLFDARLIARAEICPFTATLRKLAPALVFLLPVLAFWGLRNQVLLGNPFLSPYDDYLRRFVTAPRWFWELLTIPAPNLDPVLERYDELVAIPGARWPNPVYSAWLSRFFEGAGYAGGALLAIVALLAATLLPGRDTRPTWLMIIAMLVVTALRYPLSSAWWPFLTPALAYLALLGIGRAGTTLTKGTTTKLIAAFAVVQILLLPSAPKAKPAQPEYDFDKQRKEIVDSLSKKGGQHLAFVELDPATDARLEPADLPRDWSVQPILYARNLSPAQNATLVAAMPDRQTWRIIVLRDRIGLQLWKAPGASAAPATSP